MLDVIPGKYKDEMLKTLSGLVACPSVKGEAEPNMPYGKGIFDALMYMLDQAERMDLESVNLFGHAGYVTYGSEEEELAILVHLDVVPPGDGWDSDPFEMVNRDGMLYGRGVIDNKGPAVAALYALYMLKENCISLNKGVRLIFGCDEESGWEDMDYYLANYPEPKKVISPDSCYPVINAEKGVIHMGLAKKAGLTSAPLAIISLSSGSRPNVVPNQAECVIRATGEAVSKAAALFAADVPAEFEVEQGKETATIRVRGKAAHGSAPQEGVNALAYLIAFLNTLPLAEGDAEKFVYSLAHLIGIEYDGGRLGIAMEDEKFGMLTVNLGAMQVNENEISAKLDIRYPVGADGEEIIKKVQNAMEGQGIEAKVEHFMKDHLVPEDSDLVQALKEVYEYCFDEKAECAYSSGATYARAFKNGVAFGPVEKEKTKTEHGPNECIAIDDIVKLSEVLMYAIVRICGNKKLDR